MRHGTHRSRSGAHGSSGRTTTGRSGDLTIRDVTKPVVLDVEFEGRAPDAYGGERAGFIATTKIRRSEFGVSWNRLIEAGGVAVSDTVKITLNIEVVRQS